jgi:hypothetical protein
MSQDRVHRILDNFYTEVDYQLRYQLKKLGLGFNNRIPYEAATQGHCERIIHQPPLVIGNRKVYEDFYYGDVHILRIALIGDNLIVIRPHIPKL